MPTEPNDPAPAPRRGTVCDYDAQGRVIRTYDPPGVTATTTYDEHGRPEPPPEPDGPADEPHVVE